MVDLYRDSHRLAQLFHSDEIGTLHPQRAGIEFFLVADHHLASVSLDLYYVEWRTSRDAQSLALAHGEVMDAAMLAYDFAVGSDQFARSVRQGLALLRQVSIEKLLVVTAGDKADFLRVRLLGQGQTVLVGLGAPPSSCRPEGTGCS